MNELNVESEGATPEAAAMRVFKFAEFARFARRNGISDAQLCEVVARAERGLIDADLGGGVIKQRIARPGQGKSGGFRSILFFRAAHRTFFVYGFAKSNRANLNVAELKAYKLVAGPTLDADDSRLDELIETGELTEVKCNEENLQE